MDIFRFEFGSVDDGGDLQQLRGLGLPGEELSKVWRVQNFGFSSNPLPGSHGVGLAMLGRRDQVAVLGGEKADKRPRNTVGGGSVLYDAQGNLIYAKMAGGIEAKVVNGVFEVDVQGMKIIASSTRIDLGGPGGANVVTTSGPSSKVFAIL